MERGNINQHFARIRQMIKKMYLLLQLLYQHTQEERLTVMAGYLAYVSLLALVPLLTVMLSVASAFPVFDGIGEKIQSWVILNLMPASGDVVLNALDGFVQNASKSTLVGTLVLIVVALLLISNIDRSINHICRCDVRRRSIQTLAVYWMVLSLSPILVGASLAISSYVMSIQLINNDFVSQFVPFGVSQLPLVLSLLTFWLLYVLVPNRTIQVRHAFAGAFVAALLFEASKKIFVLYLNTFPTYQAIYGALAAVPILFIWVYLSWCIVLFGAVVTICCERLMNLPLQAEKLIGNK